MIQDFLRDLWPKFNAATYDLMKNNCNNFSDALCEFLVGTGIPVRSVSHPHPMHSMRGYIFQKLPFCLVLFMHLLPFCFLVDEILLPSHGCITTAFNSCMR
jgi:hypothetical protein